MQPNIFMWNGLVKQLCDSDLHIILDHVKASKNEIYNRNRIAGKDAKCWLTIPITNFSRSKNIDELLLDLSEISRSKLDNLFKMRYSNSPFYHIPNAILLATLGSFCDMPSLIHVYMRFLDALRNAGLPICCTVRSSDLIKSHPFILQCKGIDLVNSLLEVVAASAYLAAQNTLLYASREDYVIDDIRVQQFIYQEYSQCQSGMLQLDFVPNLSCLDTLAFLDMNAFMDYLDRSNTWCS